MGTTIVIETSKLCVVIKQVPKIINKEIRNLVNFRLPAVYMRTTNEQIASYTVEVRELIPVIAVDQTP